MFNNSICRWILRLSVYSLGLIAVFLFQSCGQPTSDHAQWETIVATGQPTARHEAGFVEYKSKLYLIGGRRINPTSVFDPTTNTWIERSETPIELHHFQPVVFGDAIYIMGAMTGPWPNEVPLERVVKYYPEKDEFIYGDTIPEHRRRGGGGAVVYNDKIYLVGGIVNGHMNGSKAWFDEYNPESGEWRTLQNAPNARDHFQAAVIDDKLYAFAGRTTYKITNQDMSLTVSHGNIYDFTDQKWETVRHNTNIPTARAGNAVFTWNNQLVIGGGESVAQEAAHSELEAYDVKTGLWSKWPFLVQGRHGTGFGVIGDYVYTASGCGKRGGEPELTTIERLQLPEPGTQHKSTTTHVDTTAIYMVHHTVTLSFKGPQTAETAAENPFLNYRLSVEVKHGETKSLIRGFYAADGNAGETSTKSGSIWQARFTPNQQGKWSYTAVLHRGDSIGLSDDLGMGELIPISNSNGVFNVIASDKEGNDFRAKGRLTLEGAYFKFEDKDEYWLKAGANSPENLLGYVDFDDTYRIKADARPGEAAATNDIHTFSPHAQDWKTGDPSWKNGKGKSLIGSINYLASKGMNSAYFLTMNIGGDGKDVWPYIAPDEFTRFDVSKLEQWEVVFQHMPSKGVLLHMVLQETENETMLDNGETGPLRQLYYRELIARFGHHLALVWNLGEENGPASWSPIGQNDGQRKAMTKFLKENDPYNHPVLLHTHAEDPLREDILNDILGYEYLDGLSLQQAERKEAGAVVELWREKSKSTGNEWLITLDEIGMWHTGALLDSEDPYHPTLRSDVLWGTLMSGAAGVEWYFGAKHPHNDLTSEDWREREQLWEITNHARVFFETYLPYWEMEPQHELVNLRNAYCFRKTNETYALYLPKVNQQIKLDLNESEGDFDVHWYNPRTGGDLQIGTVKMLKGGIVSKLGVPQSASNDDWVVLIRKRTDS